MLTLIGSWNALDVGPRALELLRQDRPLLDALVAGIQLVEDDPEELSVGYGGLPNEDGIVELDAAVMDGRTHRAGAVASVQNVRHVARLALEVMRRTDHALLAGEGATKFARLLGFPQENLLTERSRKAWLDWKANLSPRDAWLSENEGKSDFGTALWAGTPEGVADAPVNTNTSATAHKPKPGVSSQAPGVPFTYGTIHVSARDARGDLASVTSTSGLSYKIAGRVGDTPLVGSGLYTDNAIGSAGSTGRGEANLQCCGAYHTVMRMAAGRTPTEACLDTLKYIADRTKAPRLLDDKGRPNFNVTLYALRADGAYGSAAMHAGYEFVVMDDKGPRREKCAALFA
jgi:N4-(beta-N-acetylglucosaminyl)-L-asparaginase